MRLATWNIKGVLERQGLLLCWLDEQRPKLDFVALQKINVPEKDFPIDVFTRAGYYATVHSYPEAPPGLGDYGVAILSRKKPRNSCKGLPRQKALGPRFLTVEVDGLEFSSVYAPPGNNEDIEPKLAWFESLIVHIRETRSRSDQRVLCGDFNVVTEDRYGPHGPVRNSPNYHGGVQDKFRALLKAGRLFDLYSRPPRWTDPFLFEGRSGYLKLSRLEYVLGTQGIVSRGPVVEFDIDHAIVKNSIFWWVRAPIIADLKD